MSKQKTIACDKCGHRMESILESCPECGEVIRDRMDPHLEERIQKKLDAPLMNQPVWITGIIYGVIVLLYFIFYVTDFIRAATWDPDVLLYIIPPFIAGFSGVVVFVNKSAWNKNVMGLHFPNMLLSSTLLPFAAMLFYCKTLGMGFFYIEEIMCFMVGFPILFSITAFATTITAIRIAKKSPPSDGWIIWLWLVRIAFACGFIVLLLALSANIG